MLQNLKRHYVEPILSFGRPARLFLVMTILDGIIFSSWQLFFNFYLLQSGYTREFLGLVNSMPYAAALVFGILAGRFSDRVGRKPSLMLGIAMSTVCMLLEVTVRQPGLIVAAAFFNGVFNTLFLVSQAPLMMKLSDGHNRTMLFSLNYGLQTISGAVGSLFAGQLPAVFGSLLSVAPRSAAAYQAVLVCSIVLGASCLIPLWLMKEPAAQEEARPQKLTTGRATLSSWRARLSSSFVKQTMRMMAPQVIIGFGAAVLIPYMNVFFKDRFSISDSLLGILFSISSLLIGVGCLVAPRLSTGLGGKVRTIIATQSASLVFLLVAGFAPMLWLSSVGYLLRSALMNMASPLYTAFCMEQTPERHQGFVNSVLNVSWNIGWSVGPYISGVVQEKYGFSPLFIATAILYAAAIALTWFFFHASEEPLVQVQAVMPATEPVD